MYCIIDKLVIFNYLSMIQYISLQFYGQSDNTEMLRLMRRGCIFGKNETGRGDQ